MASKKEASVVEISCETLVPGMTAEELKDLIEQILVDAATSDASDLDKTGQALANKIGKKSFSSRVTVQKEGMGISPDLLTAAITLITTGTGIVAHDLWKHLVVPRLDMAYGRPAFKEKLRKQRKAEKAAEKAAKQAAKKSSKTAAKDSATTQAAENGQSEPVKKKAGKGTKSAADAPASKNAESADVKKSAKAVAKKAASGRSVSDAEAVVPVKKKAGKKRVDEAAATAKVKKNPVDEATLKVADAKQGKKTTAKNAGKTAKGEGGQE